MRDKLRILLVAESAAAGVGRHVTDLAGCLGRNGHDVHLIFSPLLMDSLFRRALIQLGNCTPNVQIAEIPMQHCPAFTDIPALNALRRHLHAIGPFDIIHSHSTKAGLFCRFGLARRPGLRVHTPHAPLTLNPQMNGLFRLGAWGMECCLARFTHGIIAVSKEEECHLKSLGIPRRKIFLVPNGIDVAPISAERHQKRSRLRETFALGAEDICIGFVGRLAPQKCVQDLLAAFERLAPTGKTRLHLAIGGDGPCRKALQQFAARLGIAERVRWLGEIDGPGVMAAFDIFALSSRYEGMPYVLLEAMAASLPVVSTRVGGTSLLVREGENGMLVPPGRPDLLAGALSRLIQDPGTRTRMGRNSLSRVQQFTIENMVDQTLSVYRSLLARQSRVSGRLPAPERALPSIPHHAS